MNMKPSDNGQLSLHFPSKFYVAQVFDYYSPKISLQVSY